LLMFTNYELVKTFERYEWKVPKRWFFSDK
jgi:hypothetical protein